MWIFSLFIASNCQIEVSGRAAVSGDECRGITKSDAYAVWILLLKIHAYDGQGTNICVSKKPIL